VPTLRDKGLQEPLRIVDKTRTREKVGKGKEKGEEGGQYFAGASEKRTRGGCFPSLTSTEKSLHHRATLEEERKGLMQTKTSITFKDRGIAGARQKGGRKISLNKKGRGRKT